MAVDGPEQLEVIEIESQRVNRTTSRYPAWTLTLGAMLLAAAGGVVVGRASDESPSASTSTTVPTSIGQPTEVSSGSLVLGVGDADAEWSFVVLDPTGRSLSVSVDDLEPPGADIAIAVRVTDGRTINVGRTDGMGCDRGTVHATCKFGPSGLDGTRPGTWVLRLEKNSQSDARIVVTVHLDR